MISSETINIETQSQSCDKPMENKIEKPSPDKAPSIGSTASSSTVPLYIEKPTLNMILHPPKSTLRKAVFNPNSQAAQFYSCS